MKIHFEKTLLPLSRPFAISRTVFHEARTITVWIEADGVVGVGQCVPQARFGESLDGAADRIAEVVSLPLTRARLQELLPAGAARNGLDCALWDLEAKQQGVPVWRLAGLAYPEPVVTAYTLSLDTPEATRLKAEQQSHRRLLKVKLGVDEDTERLEAVRAGAPASRIVVDANEGWNISRLDEIAPVLARVGVEMVEQPLPAGQDEALRERRYPFMICADESCRDRSSLPSLAGKYDMISIKLDKAGGLTEALALRRAAEAAGYRVMVGCGVASSLAIAPAVLVAQGVAVADLDGPLFLQRDCDHGLHYGVDYVSPPAPELWG